MPASRANGVSLYYEEQGTGEPIFCIPGSAAVLWAAAVEVLSAHGRTIVYDRRGWSRSERPEPLVTDVHQQADDAAALIDTLGAFPAIVIGRSYGGEIAVDLALRYPDRVRALVLLEGGGLLLSKALRQWVVELDEKIFAAAEADVGAVGETMLRGVVGDAGWEELPEHVKQVFAANGPAILAEERGGLLDVSAKQLGTIAQPILLLAAEDSPPALAEAMELMAAAMPSARVERVEGGHMINPAHTAVLGFVDEVLASTAAPVQR